MLSDKSIASFFLRVDEIIHSLRNLGDDVKYLMLVEKILRYLTPKLNSKFSMIEEM